MCGDKQRIMVQRYGLGAEQQVGGGPARRIKHGAKEQERTRPAKPGAGGERP